MSTCYEALPTEQPPQDYIDSFESWDVAKVSYLKGDLIGRGTFGQVYKLWKTTDLRRQALVMKSIHYSGQSESNAVAQEIQNLNVLANQPNIISLLAVYQSCNNSTFRVVLIFQRALCSLKAFMEERTVAPALQTRFAKHLLNGLAYTHNSDVLHRDIKPANCLIQVANDMCGALQLLLSDFGSSVKVHVTASSPTASHLQQKALALKMKYLVTTHSYAAPECWSGFWYTKQSDVWSAGVVILEMHLERPFLRTRTDTTASSTKPGNMESESITLVQIQEAWRKFQTDLGIEQDDLFATPEPQVKEHKAFRRLLLELLSWQPDERPHAREAVQRLQRQSDVTPMPTSILLHRASTKLTRCRKKMSYKDLPHLFQLPESCLPSHTVKAEHLHPKSSNVEHTTANEQFQDQPSTHKSCTNSHIQWLVQLTGKTHTFQQASSKLNKRLTAHKSALKEFVAKKTTQSFVITWRAPTSRRSASTCLRRWLGKSAKFTLAPLNKVKD